MKKTIPAVSIIIPMYNTEKYIGECLDSIFAQTFDDYEVIVVDDCSTDNSCAIVENYIQTHRGGADGKLKLIRSEKNSNTPGMPRNVGIRFSRGEYILFVDSDDAITPTALEEMYSLAEKFRVDVVHFEQYYAPKEIIPADKSLLEATGKSKALQLDKPMMMTDNLENRVKDFINREPLWTQWSYFVRRDFIIKNDIKNPPLKNIEDFLWGFYILCTAKSFLYTPNIVYIWRQRKNSLCHNVQSIDKEFKSRGNAFFHGITILDDFMNQFELFVNHYEYKYRIFDIFARATLSNNLISGYINSPIQQINELTLRELAEVNDKTALTEFIFSRMNIFNVQLNQQGAIIQKMNAYIQQQQAKINELQRRLEKNFLRS